MLDMLDKLTGAARRAAEGGLAVDDWQRPSDPISWAPRGARRGSTLARIMSEDDEEEANPSVPNVLIYVMDDVDLERVPLFAEQDAGAAAQLAELRSRRPCSTGMSNCSYDTPNLSSLGPSGAVFLGAHVPASVCTPSRYAILTGRLPSSAPFNAATARGRFGDVSWNTYLRWSGGYPCPAPSGAGCTRASGTLGSLLQRSGYFTGFVGKFHLARRPHSMEEFMRGEHGRFVTGEEMTPEAVAANDALSAGYGATVIELEAAVREAGFNFTGAVESGNVIDSQHLGLGVHNAEWEAEAALRFLQTASSHLTSRAAAGFYLHFCTTLTHAPGAYGGLCADERLCEGGLLSAPPDSPSHRMPPRSSLLALAGSQPCGWEEYDAPHTAWMDAQVGAVLAELRSLQLEQDTLLIALSDHQRYGKGALYHGVRTPMMLQWPARIAPGQTFAAHTLVSSLDLVPTVLDAAGLLSRGVPANAGGPLDGRSLLPLLKKRTLPGMSAGDARDSAGDLVNSPWREALWLELGFSTSVKHRTGWQLVSTVFPPSLVLNVPQARHTPFYQAVRCDWQRLGLQDGGFTHARECHWRDSGANLSLSVFGLAASRFDDEHLYPQYSAPDALVHTIADRQMATVWQHTCPRQMACMQLLLRERALARTDFDGAPIAFGIYTATAEEWALFHSGTCDTRVLSLPPQRCNASLSAEDGRGNATVAPSAAAPASETTSSQPPRYGCSDRYRNCWLSRCCAESTDRCYTHSTGLRYAQCMPTGSCHHRSWECVPLDDDALLPSPAPTAPPTVTVLIAPPSPTTPSHTAVAGNGHPPSNTSVAAAVGGTFVGSSIFLVASALLLHVACGKRKQRIKLWTPRRYAHVDRAVALSPLPPSQCRKSATGSPSSEAFEERRACRAGLHDETSGSEMGDVHHVQGARVVSF